MPTYVKSVGKARAAMHPIDAGIIILQRTRGTRYVARASIDALLGDAGPDRWLVLVLVLVWAG